MLSFRRSAMLLVAAAAMAETQPALTTIQDSLYRADGTRFNGEIFISWNAFQAGDTSNIATAQPARPSAGSMASACGLTSIFDGSSVPHPNHLHDGAGLLVVGVGGVLGLRKDAARTNDVRVEIGVERRRIAESVDEVG